MDNQVLQQELEQAEKYGLGGLGELLVEEILMEAAEELRNIWKEALDAELKKRAKAGFFKAVR